MNNVSNTYETGAVGVSKRTFLFGVIVGSLVSVGCSALLTTYLIAQSSTAASPDGVSSKESYATIDGMSMSHEGGVPDIVERAVPAVVSVVISADVPVIEQYYDEYNPFGDFFGGFGFQIPRERQVGTEKREIGGGTGFIVSEDGYVLTNRHVVDTEGASYSVLLNDGQSHEVKVIAKDPYLDIAVLKIESEGPFPALLFGDSETLRLGGTVIAIGNALAEFPNSVSVGVVSGLLRDIVAQDGYGTTESLEGVIQTDAAINPGNSGGPLLDASGRVIGMNVAVAGNSENIGFAIPSNIVREVYENVRENGKIVRPYIGVRYMEITKDLAKENDLPVEYGVLIVRGESRLDLAVIPGSPADKAGIEENDIILQINGEKLDGSKSFGEYIRSFKVGETITLTVLHDGEERQVSVLLEKAPE